jgi:hypothetical protein
LLLKVKTMKRCFIWTFMTTVMVAGTIHADEVPSLPKNFSADGSWNYMKVVADADGKPLLKVFQSDSQFVTEMRTVTKLVKETRVVDGQTITLEIPKVEAEPVQVEVRVWKAIVAALDDPRLQFFDMKGQPIALDAVRERLAKPTVAKWATQQPDPFYLRSAKADTILLIAPPKAFAQLPGASKEPLPTKGSWADFGYARCSTAPGKRVVEFLLLNAKSSKATDFKTVAIWDVMEAPLDHPELKVTTQQGKAISTAEIIERFKEWTPILFAPTEPHPIYVSGTNPEMLIVAPPMSEVRKTVREYGQPPWPENNPPKTPAPPKIDRLPMPVTPPLPPLPVDPKPQPVDPKPAPIDPQPKLPAGGDAAPEGAPPIAVVKKMLEVQWGPLGRFTKHQYDFKSIRFGPPMKEVVTVNGQGQFTGKVRYPVRVLCDINVLFNDGTSRMETKHQTFHFFLDPFNEWSFRFIENN